MYQNLCVFLRLQVSGQGTYAVDVWTDLSARQVNVRKPFLSSITILTAVLMWTQTKQLYKAFLSRQFLPFVACYKGRTTGNFFTSSLLLCSFVDWQIQIFKSKSLINFKWAFQMYCIFIFPVCFVFQLEHFTSLLLEYSMVNPHKNVELKVEIVNNVY